MMTNQRTFIIKTPEIRSNAAKAVMAIKGEDNMEVIIQPHKDDQTSEQRGFWHVLIGILAKELGYSPEEMKVAIKAETWGSEQKEVFGKTREVVKSSACAKKDEYSELIETTYRLGAEYGIVLPNPRYRG